MIKLNKIHIKTAMIAFLILANGHLCFSQNTKTQTRQNEVQLKLGLSAVESISTNNFDALSVSLVYTRMLNKWFYLGVEYITTTKNNLPDWFNENIVFNPSEHFDQIINENIIGKPAYFDIDNPINYYRSSILFLQPHFNVNTGNKFKLFFYPMIGFGVTHQTELLLVSFSHANNVITEVQEYRVLSWNKKNFYSGFGLGCTYKLSSNFFINLDARLTSRLESSESHVDTFGSSGYGTVFIGTGVHF